MTTDKTLRILTISGSLRQSSSHTRALEAARRLAPACIEVVPYLGLSSLPAFNPDLRHKRPGRDPAPVNALAQAVTSADALWFACPEYAGGIPGALKNALDWLVGTPHFSGKPVGIINASPRATHAVAALRLVLRMMDGRCVQDACITLPLLGKGLDVEDIVQAQELSSAIQTGLNALTKAL